jgi:predicted permease
LIAVLGTLAPIFAIIVLGALLRAKRFAPAELFRGMNRLVYFVATPCLLFYQTAEARIQGDAAVRVFAVLTAAGLASGVLAYALGRALRLPAKSLAAFTQGGFRGNVAFVGLPVIALAFAGAGSPLTGQVNTLAVLAIAFMIPIYNLAAVALLTAILHSDATSRRGQIRRLLRDIATNPLVLSCVAGLIVSFAGWPLPPVVRQTLKMLGDMTTPLALICIGAGLTVVSARANLRHASLAALTKVGIAPLAGYIIGTQLGLSAVELRVALIFLACPTASTSYVMAQLMGADEGLAANIIVVSTLLTFPALSLVLLAT